MSFLLKAPAKINWFLSVLGKRTDGYHDIASLMQQVSLYDTLHFEESEDLEVLSAIPGLGQKDNLVYRAAALLRTASGGTAGARIRLSKEIPVAAGLGGGSSDAAAALVGLNSLWNLGLGVEALRELAARIGSDVPFFIADAFALIEGRGERITSLGQGSELPLLLVNPGIPVSAGWAYGALPARLTKKSVDIKLFCQCLDRKDFEILRSLQVNDLEEPVMTAFPEIRKVRDRLLEAGAAMAAMSGSGSTVFGLFETDGEAETAAAEMDAWWCRSVKTLRG